MITISFGTSFKHAYQKRILSNEKLKKIVETLEIFRNDPFDTRLRTHKLRGKLAGMQSFRVEYDVRVVFYFSEPQHAVLVDVGTHDEVY